MLEHIFTTLIYILTVIEEQGSYIENTDIIEFFLKQNGLFFAFCVKYRILNSNKIKLIIKSQFPEIRLFFFKINNELSKLH